MLMKLFSDWNLKNKISLLGHDVFPFNFIVFIASYSMQYSSKFIANQESCKLKPCLWILLSETPGIQGKKFFMYKLSSYIRKICKTRFIGFDKFTFIKLNRSRVRSCITLHDFLSLFTLWCPSTFLAIEETLPKAFDHLFSFQPSYMDVPFHLLTGIKW